MNNKLLIRLTGIILLALMVISIFFVGLVMFGPTGEQMATPDGGEMPVPKYTDTLMYWIYVLAGFTALVTVVLAIIKFVKNMIENPKRSIKPLILVVGLVLIFIISWSLGSQEKLPIFGYEGTENEGFMAQFIDMFLFSIYALFGLIVLAIIGSRIYVKLK